MTQNDYNSVLITEKLEYYYRNKLSEEKIMSSSHLKNKYLNSLFVMAAGVLMLFISLIIAFYHASHSNNTPINFLMYMPFTITACIGFASFFGGNCFRYSAIVENFTGNKKINNLFLFKKAEDLLNNFKYHQLKNELIKDEYKNKNLERLAQFYKEKSSSIEKQALYPITIVSILFLSLWGAYLGAIIGDSSLTISLKTEAALFFLLISLVVFFVIYGFRIWYDHMFLGKAKLLSQLSKSLELVILERDHN